MKIDVVAKVIFGGETKMRSILRNFRTKKNVDDSLRYSAGKNAAQIARIAIIAAALFGCSRLVFSADLSKAATSRPILNSGASAPLKSLALLPMADTNLILTGTILGSPGRALIRLRGGREELFTVGQTIAGDIVLLTVYRHSAVISRDGTLEKVRLHASIGSSNAGPVAVTSYPEAVTPNTPVAYEMNYGEEANGAMQSGQQFEQVVFADRLFRSQDASSKVKISALSAGGVQLSDIAEGSLYRQLGLNDGDEVVSVNDKAVNSAGDLESMLQQRNSTDKLQISVMRGGNLYEIHYDPASGIQTGPADQPVN